MMNCSSSVLGRSQLVLFGFGFGRISLEAQLVDKGSGDSSKDRSQKVEPQIFGSHCKDNIWSKGPGGVHAGAGQGNGEQVASGDGKTNGQGCRSFDVGTVVAISSGSKDNQNQNEGDEEFDAKSLSYADLVIQWRHSNSLCRVDQVTQKGLKYWIFKNFQDPESGLTTLPSKVRLRSDHQYIEQRCKEGSWWVQFYLQRRVQEWQRGWYDIH